MNSSAEQRSRSLKWRELFLGIPFVEAAQWQQLSHVQRWLIATRASVLPLTLFAVFFALCLAPPVSFAGWGAAALATLALLFAHATNNLINDYVDYHAGLDRDNYARAQYGVHVLSSGLMSPRALRAYIYTTGSAAFALGLLVCAISVREAVYFALAGAALVLFYTYPLKRMALGELAVFAAWGPLMVGGLALVSTGELPDVVLWAGAVYGLGPSLVICAKHTDKLSDDRARRIRTLPNILGERGARLLLIAVALAQISGMVWLAWRWQLWGLLAGAATLPQLYGLIRVYLKPPPSDCPAEFPAHAWPLWYTTQTFLYARNIGLWMILGLLSQHIFWL